METQADKKPKERFSTRAKAYALYRPSYPAALLTGIEIAIRTARPAPVPILADQGPTPGFSLADIGSGTGILAKLLLERGHKVFAVEPNAEMRSCAEEDLGDYSGFTSLPGEATVTGLSSASMDAVLCAQAFHWFSTEEAAAEFLRIAKDGAPIVLCWNIRVDDSLGFKAAYEGLLSEFCPEYSKNDAIKLDEAAIRKLFPNRSCRIKRYEHGRKLDFPQLRGALESASYCLVPAHPEYPALMRGLRGLFDRYSRQGKVGFEYACMAYYLESPR